MPWMAMIPAAMSMVGSIAGAATGAGKGSASAGSAGNTAQNQTQQTQYPDWYNQYTQDVLSRGKAAVDKPYEAYDVNKMFAGFTPDQQQAFNQIRGFQGAYQPYFDQGKGALDRVQGMDSKAAAQPYLDAAGKAVRPWQAGSGAIQDSMGKWTDPGNRDAYMQDYRGALDRANELTERRFNEKTMPEFNKQFAMGEGALGRSNYQKMGNRAVRDLGNEISGNSQTMMNEAYKNAASIYASDEARQQAGGERLGALANTNMSALGDLASRNATITSGAVQNGINVANAYSTNAGALSNLNLMNTNALLNAGNQQQQQNQLPLTAQYQQWQQEQQKPYVDTNFLAALPRNFQIPTTTNTNANTMNSSSNTSSSSPSIVGQIQGGINAANTLGATTDASGKTTGGIQNLITGVGNLFDSPTPNNPGLPSNPNDATANAARGGRIPNRYAQGGAVPRGILSRRRRQDNYAVGGDIPVGKGMKSRARKGGPKGALGGLPPPLPAGGPFDSTGGLPMPPPEAMAMAMPPPGGLPRPPGLGAGPLGRMR